VARGTGHGAVAGQFGIVKKTAAIPDYCGSWVVTADGNFLKYGVGGGIDDRNRIGDAVKGV